MKCKCVATGDGNEASACRFSSRLKWFFFLFCYHSLKMGLLILLKFLILFRLKWILFDLIYGVVWAIFGFRVQEFGADLCYCLSIFLV